MKVQTASDLADELLGGAIPLQEIEQQAKGLYMKRGQSEYDLATQVALWFFRNPGGRWDKLVDAQLNARMEVLEWSSKGRVKPIIVWAFEQSLYKIYKPT